MYIPKLPDFQIPDINQSKFLQYGMIYYHVWKFDCARTRLHRFLDAASSTPPAHNGIGYQTSSGHHRPYGPTPRVHFVTNPLVCLVTKMI